MMFILKLNFQIEKHYIKNSFQNLLQCSIFF